jgi:hypothetical protein
VLPHHWIVSLQLEAVGIVPLILRHRVHVRTFRALHPDGFPSACFLWHDVLRLTFDIFDSQTLRYDVRHQTLPAHGAKRTCRQPDAHGTTEFLDKEPFPLKIGNLPTLRTVVCVGNEVAHQGTLAGEFAFPRHAATFPCAPQRRAATARSAKKTACANRRA